MDETTRETGIRIFTELMGEDMARQVQAFMKSDGFGTEQAKWAFDFAFGSVWARDGLERKLRSCVVLGLLIGLRQHDEIKHHTKIGVRNGLSRTELEEIFYTALPYAGFPAAQNAKSAMLEALAELDS